MSTPRENAGSDSPPVVLVTGARRGIGKAIALRLAQQADLALNDIADGRQELEGVAEEIRAGGREALVVTADVRDSAQVDAMVKQVVDRFGRLDILVNNAGVTRDGLLIRMSDEQWKMVLDINLTGAFLCSRAAAKVMLRQRPGRAGAGGPGHQSQRRGSRVHRVGHDGGAVRRRAREALRSHSFGPPRPARGRGRGRGFPCFSGGGLHHRAGLAG